MGMQTELRATPGPRQKPVRVGIVGTGWGANHARVVHELAPALEVAALCSRRQERLEPLRDELHLPDTALEQRWERLVERPDVDLVVVTTPDDLHHPITLAALHHGKHVFCDKPLAMNASQAEEMLRAAQAARVAHFTGFTWRFAPPFATLLHLITRGELGEVHHLDGHFRIGPPLSGKEWQLTPEQRSGGVFSNLTVHLIDLVRYLTGHTAKNVLSGADALQGWRVWATGDGQLSEPNDPAGEQSTAVHQSGWLHLRFPVGSTILQARLQASQQVTLRASDPVRMEVHGSRASAIGYANPLKPHLQRVDLVPQISAERQTVQALLYPGGPPAPPTAQLPSGGLLRPTILHLYEAHILPRLVAHADNPETPTFVDGFLAQRLLDAALRSVMTGHWETP